MDLRWATVLPLLLVGLAGCLDDDPDFDARRSAAVPVLVFEDPVQLTGRDVSGEPNVVAGPAGKVWVVGVGSLVRDPNVLAGELGLWRSDDAGQNYSRLRAASQGQAPWPITHCSCDTDIDLDVDGTLYLTDFWVTSIGAGAGAVAVGAGLNGFVVESSNDDGDSWNLGNPVTVTRPMANDRQYITAGDEAGEVFLSYARSDTDSDLGTGDGGLFVWRSTDHGATFPAFTQAVPTEPDMFPIIAKMRVGPDGALFLPYVQSHGGATPSEIMVAVSRDDGATWSSTQVGAMRWGHPNIWPMQADVDPDGTLHVVWQESQEDEVGSLLWYATSDDSGATFTEPAQVGWQGHGTAMKPWVAAAGSRQAIVAFYGTPDTVNPWEADPETEWHAWSMVVGDESDEPAPVSPWPVKRGVFCPLGAACANNRELLDYPAVDWADGWAHVAFAVSNEDARVGPDDQPDGTPRDGPTGGHDTNASLWVARAFLPEG